MNIAIIDNSIAANTIIDQIRSKDQESTITLFCVENVLPYSRERMSSYIRSDIGFEELIEHDENYYQKNKVNIVKENAVTRINLNRKKIYTEDKTQFDFDILILGDSPDKKLPEIKGANKEGAYGFNSLMGVQKIIDYTPLIDTVAIQADNISGFQTAAALAHRKKEVYLAISEHSLFAELFADEGMQEILNAFNESGLKIYVNNAFDEILGEGEVRAVRLESGKVIGAQLAICQKQRCDLRILGEGITVKHNSISVNENFQSEVENIYVFDKAAHVTNYEDFTSDNILRDQGKRITRSILGGELESEQISYDQSIIVGDCQLDLIGQYSKHFDGDIKMEYSRENLTCRRLYLKDGILMGAILINGAEDIEQIMGQLNKPYQEMVHTAEEEVLEVAAVDQQAGTEEAGSSENQENTEESEENKPL